MMLYHEAVKLPVRISVVFCTECVLDDYSGQSTDQATYESTYLHYLTTY